jgi:hypothetical protein
MRGFIATLTFVVLAAAAVVGLGSRWGASAQAPAFRCGAITHPVSVAPTMPVNFYAADGQAGADCMAWQEFIYLNWRVDPNNPGEPDPSASPANFGVPNSYTTVWESYPIASAVMAPGSTLRSALAATRKAGMRLSTTSKLSNIVLGETGQAGNGAWLTDQLGGLTYYQVHVNKDEAQYVSTNRLQTANGQLTCTQGTAGFNLPAGSQGIDYTCTGAKMAYGDNMGAVEIKAAWIELTNPSLYPKFLIANAQIQPPSAPPHPGVVGLVGLHVIHKVPYAQQFVWATFEHINNDPQSTPVSSASPFNFYKPGCNAQTDYYHCQINHQPASGDPYNAPVQVMRISAMGPLATSLNAYVWSLLPATSVFRNYQLVDTLWPSANATIPPGANTPLTYGNAKSETAYLANTTLETYFQGPSPGPLACLNCHTGAPIATSSKAAGRAKPMLVRNALGQTAKLLTLPRPRTKPGSSTTPASDYSFIFFNFGQ